MSEWMGYFLLRESMLDSVVVARYVNQDRQVWLMLTACSVAYCTHEQSYSPRERGA